MDVYSPVGDMITIAICVVLLVLLLCSYIRRTRSFRIFLLIIGFLILAAGTSIANRLMLDSWNPSLTVPVCAARVVMHTSLYAIFHLFVLYIADVTRLNRKEARIATLAAGVLLVAFVLFELIGIFTGIGFRIDADGTVHTGVSAFSFGYLLFVALNVVMLFRVRSRIYNRVMNGFFFTVILAVVLNLAQRINGRSSYTVVSFLFPVLAMLYFMHSNPYDTQIGAVDVNAMEDYIHTARSRRQPFGFMSLFLPSFEADKSEIPEDLQAVMRKVAAEAFRSSVLFHVGRGHYILAYPKDKNPDEDSRIREVLTFFSKQYAKYRYDYKIVIGQSVDKAISSVDYVSFIRNIHHSMQENTIYTVESHDSSAYDRYEYILAELADIHAKRDPDDPRVLVYCQPVYNLELKRYDTAEALMRLHLEKIGIVYPNDFIHVAEENGYIHVLTEIILHKTCEGIRRLTAEGFSFSRISVNVSAQEFKESGFCDDILEIIRESDVPADRVAIELTESENGSDFLVAQEKISELKERGICFYLDDFGTGYSSMERIMQLPFDIIKFDRSLVIASATDPKAAAMVRSMAQLFRDLDYSVLYEGIETTTDEERCSGMSASYLQGYKYSRPVPLEEMGQFFSREN